MYLLSIQIEGNAGAGLFSNETVSLKVLEKALSKKTLISAGTKLLRKGGGLRENFNISLKLKHFH